MRADTKQYKDMSDTLRARIEAQGYTPVTPDKQSFFDPYYDAMEGHWSANTSFLNLWAWKESYPAFYKEFGENIILINYLRTEGYPVAVPCLGPYSNENVQAVIGELKKDFAAFEYPLVFMDITPWMLPYYTSGDTQFDIEDLREYQDYVFTPEEFLAGMDMQDDRYRYRYFKRKFEYETVEITPELYDECSAFMEEHWCGDKTCDECHCGCLKKVVENLVPNFDTLRVYGILVRVNGEAAGICIVTSRNGLGIYQYKNAINKIKGLNEYLLRECFERYMQGKVDMINYTEDMGVESLRYYKEHMAPSYSLLSKYTLTIKE